MAVSAFLTAVGGTFYAQYFTFIDPGLVFGPSVSVEILLRPIVGGPGTLLGPLLGSVVLTPLSEATRALIRGRPGVDVMVYGALLVIVITFLRGAGRRVAPDFPAAGALAAPASLSDNVPLLEVRGLTKRFGGLLAVSRVELVVERGEVCGIIGPNGAGKTTLFHLMTGFHRPTAGEVRFDGRSIAGLRPAPSVPARHRAHVPDRPAVSRADRPRTMRRSAPFTRATGMWRRRARPPAKPSRWSASKTRADRLAGDPHPVDRRRLELARALATGPRLLLLDEVIVRA